MKIKKQLRGAFALTVLTILLVMPVFVFATSSQNIIDGDLVKTADNPDVYIVKLIGIKKFKRLILNPEIFNSYGHLRWDKIKTIDQGTVDAFTSSDLVIEVNADGSVADPKVYKVAAAPNSDAGERRWLNLTASEFEAAGLDWDSLYYVNHKEASPGFYPTKEAHTYQTVLQEKKEQAVQWKLPAPAPSVMLSIALVAPDRIVAGYPTNIIIKGSGFNNGTKVDFGSGGIQPAYGVISDTQISILVPSGMPALTYNLTITNSDGQIAVLKNALTVQEAPASIENQLTASQIFDIVSPSVVQIGCGDGVGSGFVFEGSGYILTNEHVVKGCSTVEVKLKNNTILQGSVLGEDAVNDVAVVKVNSSLPTLVLGNSDESVLRLGSSIFVVGHPIGLSNAVITRGLLTSRQPSGLGYDRLTTDASTEGGSSGGPWINEKGEVIGLHQAALLSIKISIPINFIKGIIPTLKAGTSTPAPAPTPTPTPTPMPTTPTTFTVAKNTTIANMSVVAGQTGVTIGSWLLTAGAAEAVDVNTIVLKDATTGGETWGDAFNNLKLYSGSTQLGSTITSPTATGDAVTQTFNLSTPLRITAGQSVQVDLVADVITGASWTTDEVAIDSASATGVTTNATVSYAGDSAGQDIEVATAGALTVAVAATPTNPNTQYVVSGDTEQVIAAWKFSASNVEDLKTYRIKVKQVQTDVDAPKNVKNLKLYVGSTQVSSTISALTNPDESIGGDEYAIFEDTTNGLFSVAKNGNVTLTLKADITPSTNAAFGTNGEQFKFRISNVATHTSSTDISAKGTLSGAFATGSAANYDGNSHIVVKSKPTFALNSASPSGTLVNGTVEVIRFNITAHANNDVVFDGTNHNVRFTITESSNAALSATTADLYDAATNTTIATQLTPDFDTDGTFSFTTISTTIPAGQTKTYYVKAGLSGYSTAGDSFQVSINNAAADLSWSDTVTSADINNASVSNIGLPINGGVLVKP